MRASFQSRCAAWAPFGLGDLHNWGSEAEPPPRDRTAIRSFWCLVEWHSTSTPLCPSVVHPEHRSTEVYRARPRSCECVHYSQPFRHGGGIQSPLERRGEVGLERAEGASLPLTKPVRRSLVPLWVQAWMNQLSFSSNGETDRFSLQERLDCEMMRAAKS
jgi:hypothetical protein